MSVNLPGGKLVLFLAIFVVVLILTVVATVFGLRFLQPTDQKNVTIGIARWIDNPEQNKNIESFKKTLTNSGFVEGKNIVYLIPEASGANREKHQATIKFFIDKRVNLIYSLTTPGTLIAKEQTSSIPIVFSIVTYPKEAGIVVSLQNSGSNLVGTRNWVPATDQIAVFLEIAPKTKSIGFIHRRDEPNSTIQFQEFQEAAKPLDIKVIEIAPKVISDLTNALESAINNVDSLYSACDTLVQAEQGEDTIIAFAKNNKIPDFTCNESGVIKGSLIGTVADFEEIGKLAGEKASVILKGASPTSLETNTVARPYIYVNKNTASNLGIEIPQNISLKAKKIIK